MPDEKHEKEPLNETLLAMFAPDTEAYYANAFGIASSGDELIVGFGQADPTRKQVFSKRVYMTMESAANLHKMLKQYFEREKE